MSSGENVPVKVGDFAYGVSKGKMQGKIGWVTKVSWRNLVSIRYPDGKVANYAMRNIVVAFPEEAEKEGVKTAALYLRFCEEQEGKKQFTSRKSYVGARSSPVSAPAPTPTVSAPTPTVSAPTPPPVSAPAAKVDPNEAVLMLTKKFEEILTLHVQQVNERLERMEARMNEAGLAANDDEDVVMAGEEYGGI